eukprot:778406-Pleurochrysis_carterae.AAC.1
MIVHSSDVVVEWQRDIHWACSRAAVIRETSVPVALECCAQAAAASVVAAWCGWGKRPASFAYISFQSMGMPERVKGSSADLSIREVGSMGTESAVSCLA